MISISRLYEDVKIKKGNFLFNFSFRRCFGEVISSYLTVKHINDKQNEFSCHIFICRFKRKMIVKAIYFTCARAIYFLRKFNMFFSRSNPLPYKNKFQKKLVAERKHIASKIYRVRSTYRKFRQEFISTKKAY